MPVEPTDKNFRSLKKESLPPPERLHTAANDEKCPIIPLYVGMNCTTKIVNILYYRNEKTSHYTTSETSEDSSTVQQRAT